MEGLIYAVSLFSVVPFIVINLIVSIFASSRESRRIKMCKSCFAIGLLECLLIAFLWIGNFGWYWVLAIAMMPGALFFLLAGCYYRTPKKNGGEQKQ